MNFISIITLCFISQTIYALKTVKPKLCIHCKHFIPDDNSDRYARCQFFPKGENEVYKLIDGNGMNNDYYLCSIARNYEDMCGKQGTFYKKKRVKNTK